MGHKTKRRGYKVVRAAPYRGSQTAAVPNRIAAAVPMDSHALAELANPDLVDIGVCRACETRSAAALMTWYPCCEERMVLFGPGTNFLKRFIQFCKICSRGGDPPYRSRFIRGSRVTAVDRLDPESERHPG